MSISRDEFQDILWQVFNPAQYFTNDLAIVNIYTSDGNRIPWMIGIHSDLEDIVNTYLSNYDAASTDAQRDAVVASVSNNYSAPAMPAADPGEYNWPHSLLL